MLNRHVGQNTRPRWGMWLALAIATVALAVPTGAFAASPTGTEYGTTNHQVAGTGGGGGGPTNGGGGPHCGSPVKRVARSNQWTSVHRLRRWSPRTRVGRPVGRWHDPATAVGSGQAVLLLEPEEQRARSESEAAERAEDGLMVNSANTRDTRVVVPVALRALEAQRLVSLIAYAISPALAAGLIAYVHMGDVGYALLVAAAMLAALQLVERSTLPLGLMPAARLGLGLCAPVLGAAAAVVLALAAGQHMALAELKAPVAGAWLIMGLGAWVTARFDDDRRARVAVVGSPGFAIDLADELEAAGIRAYEVIGWFGRRLLRRTRRTRLPSATSTISVTSTRFARLSSRGRSSCSSGTRGAPSAGDGATPDPDPYALIADSCLDLPVRMIEANQLYEELLGHVPLGTTDAAWFRYIMHPRFRPTSPLSKRCFDLAIAACDGARRAAAGRRSRRSRSSSPTAARCSTASGGSASAGGSSRSSSCGRWCRTRRPAARSGPRRTTSA